MAFYGRLVALVIVIALGGSSEATNNGQATGTPFMEMFSSKLDTKLWYIAKYDHPAEHFVTAWRRPQVALTGDKLILDLTRSRGQIEKPFVSGEVQRRGTFGYGRYEAVLQPSSEYGVVTGFFVFTGRPFGTSHEEIDFEFLGRDTRSVYLNHFVDGKPLLKRLQYLGFDSAAAPKLYAFEWSESGIIWYADGREIHRVRRSDVRIPRPPAKIYMNLLAGGERHRNWAGVAPPNADGRATFFCLSYQEPGGTTAQCSDHFETSMTEAGQPSVLKDPPAQ
ncbi:MAG: family 16 glycosylhydrolase [Pseudomonadota bacterium]